MNPTKLHRKTKEKRLELLFEAFGDALIGYGHKQWKIPKDACWDLIYTSLYKVESFMDTHQFESAEKFNGFVFRIFINNMKNFLQMKRRGQKEPERLNWKRTKLETAKKVTSKNGKK